ncbi:10273_t:CDS:2 [Cetraspora pellucida]|uniref:10273_t:CDS:1 n=1 Tax=Cetraspora pellucida TaxID=1433469 RepID=A0A9N9GBQ3_9GLOM|nr:10273_t:CDS:2 [Cetraspora pellucida]
MLFKYNRTYNFENNINDIDNINNKNTDAENENLNKYINNTARSLSITSYFAFVLYEVFIKKNSKN